MSFLRRSNGNYASIQTRRPLARSEDLILEEFEDDLLVYDRKTQRAHCLGETAARVWRACDGETDVDGLSSALDLTRDTVLRAVEELEASELLDVQELEVLNGNGNGITRRQLTTRSAKVGAAAVAAPLVYSIAVPSAMAAASPTNFQCALFSDNDCGVNKGAGGVPGCCCCCQGGGNCKVGGSLGSCSTEVCPSGGTGHCSSSCNPPPCDTPLNSSGCCGTSGAGGCGCAFAGPLASSTQSGCLCNDTSGGCNKNPQTGCASNCTPGAANCGAGCCNTSTCTSVPVTGGHVLINCPACQPGDTNCVPCCNGSPISQTTPSPFGCCTPGPASTCVQNIFA